VLRVENVLDPGEPDSLFLAGSERDTRDVGDEDWVCRSHMRFVGNTQSALDHFSVRPATQCTPRDSNSNSKPAD
jgi:hypothetical protein